MLYFDFYATISDILLMRTNYDGLKNNFLFTAFKLYTIFRKIRFFVVLCRSECECGGIMEILNITSLGSYKCNRLKRKNDFVRVSESYEIELYDCNCEMIINGINHLLFSEIIVCKLFTFCS